MADYGLDPSVLAQPAIGYGQAPPVAPPMPAPTSSYGLDPSVLAGVQNGFAPPPQQVQNTIPEPVSMLPGSVPLPPPPPPPPTQKFGVDSGIAGAPSEVANVAPPETVPSVTGGTLPSQDAATLASQPTNGLPVQSTPDQVIGSVAPLTPKQVAATNKVYDAQQAQQKAFANSPEGIAQKADAERLAAIDKQRQAAADADAAAVEQNNALTKATQDSNDRIAAQEKIAAAQRAKDQNDVAQYSQQYAQQIKDAANFKVNTNRDIGASGAIAVALSGIGDAIAHVHGPNAALEILNKRADQRIADQWQQKKSLGDTAAGTKDLLETSRQTSSDDRQNQDVEKAAILTDYNNQVKLTAAQSANPLLKARALQISAGLDDQVAGLTSGLANRKLDAQKTAADQQYKNNELGVQYGHLKLAQDAQKNAIEQQKFQNSLEVEKLNAEGNAKAAAALKAAQDNGIFATDGTTVKGEDGTLQPKYTLLTNQDGSPAQVKEKLQEDFAKKDEGFRKAMSALDNLRQMRSDDGGNLFNSSDARGKSQEFERAAAGLLEANGSARISGEILEHAKEQIAGGADPTSVVKSIMPALNQFRKDLDEDKDGLIRTHSNYTGKKYQTYDPLSAPKPVPTPDENQLSAVLRKPSADQFAAEVGDDPQAAFKSGEIDLKEYQRRIAAAGQQLDRVGILPSQKQMIDNWAATLSNPSAPEADKQKAQQNLTQATQTAESKSIKNYAQAAQIQAAVNSHLASPTEDTSLNKSSVAADTSYGGAAQTPGAQKQIEQASVDALRQQAIAAPAGSSERTDARQEIIRRADAGDKKAAAALVQLFGER